MSWTPKNSQEAYLRAAGRRAYNKKRRLARAARISRIWGLLDQDENISGRELAVLCGVHEATISRDLKFIFEVRERFKQLTGCQMRARNFSWTDEANGYQTVFRIRNGVRVL
jgi:hypothetical protein